MAKRHIKYEYEGKLYTVPELGELANIGKSEMYKRLAKMSVTDAVNYVAPKKIHLELNYIHIVEL